jgi:hypothetical protein
MMVFQAYRGRGTRAQDAPIAVGLLKFPVEHTLFLLPRVPLFLLLASAHKKIYPLMRVLHIKSKLIQNYIARSGVTDNMVAQPTSASKPPCSQRLTKCVRWASEEKVTVKSGKPRSVRNAKLRRRLSTRDQYWYKESGGGGDIELVAII